MIADEVKQGFPKGILRDRHPFFMHDSINEIPDSMLACLEPDFLNRIIDFTSSIKPESIYAVGCGTSLNSSKAMVYGIQNFMPTIKSSAMNSLDFCIDPPSEVDSKSLIISSSHSGETKPTCLAQKLAKRNGAKTISITGVSNKPLASAADFSIVDPLGKEFPYGKTRSYLTTSLIGMLIAASCKGSDDLKEFGNIITKLTNNIRDCIPYWEESVKRVSLHWGGEIDRYMTVGYGIQSINADEIALKIIEIIGEGAMSFGLEEFTHGMAASLWKNLGVIIFQSDERVFKRTLQIAKGVSSTQSSLLVITNHCQIDWPRKCEVISVPVVRGANHLSLFPLAIVGQLLVYHLAVKKGYQPDINCRDRNPEALVAAKFFKDFGLD